MRLQDQFSSDCLLKELDLIEIQTLLRYNRLCWFCHISRNDSCINNITEFKVGGQRGRGRSMKAIKDTINDDCRYWKLARVDLLNRIEWTKHLRANIGTVQPTLCGNVT